MSALARRALASLDLTDLSDACTFEAAANLVARASDIAIAAEADFLKTSTGKTPISATPAAARVMLERIRASGKPVGFKASGGVRTLADAAVYLALADEIMGPAWATPATFRFGASGLLDALLADIADEPPARA